MHEERLRMTGLNTLETRRLRAHMLEVYKIVKSVEGTDELKLLQRRVGRTIGQDLKLFKTRVKLDILGI